MNTTTKKPPEVVGIDLGNTIIRHRDALPHAIRVIARLVNERFGTNVHIVSRVSPEQEIRARAWLKNSGFHPETGVLKLNVHFCAERHEKAPIAKQIGATHFIDDRPEVMIHMPHVPYRILFDPDPDDMLKFRDQLGSGVLSVKDWLAVESLLIPA
jgi:hypothetical protein